jgi:FkbM family methyltransferase
MVLPFAASGAKRGRMASSTPTSESPPFGSYPPTRFVAWALARTRAAAGRSWLEQRLTFLLRRLAIRSLRGKPVDTEALGAKMRLFPQGNICEKRVLFTPQLFDARELGHLSARIKPGYRFVDIGANVGVYSLFVAARAGPKARILAVEPQPQVFVKLAYNIAQNPFGTIKAVACAVADKAGELTLFLDPRNEGESSVRTLRGSPAQSVKVPAVALADLLTAEGFAHVDGMKIDVEGAEDLILEPFLTPRNEALWPRTLILEDSRPRWSTDLKALLERCGYRETARTRLNFIFERD